MTKERRRRHTPEQIVAKLRDADAILNAGKELAIVLRTLKYCRGDLLSLTSAVRWREE